MIYCDTSLLVAALAREPDSGRSQEWLAMHSGHALCVSDWVVTEFAGALAFKQRTGQVSAELRAQIRARWQKLVTNTLAVDEVRRDAFELAARFCNMQNAKLRSGDALHLAIASLGGHSLATLDRAMAEAAVAVGVGVVPV